MILNCIKYLLFFSILCNTLIAQFTIDTSKHVNYLAIPVLFRTPETGWAYGLSSSLTFKTSNKNDSLTRTSVIQGLAIFSQKEQNIQAIDATIYFPKESYILYFQSNHSYFPDVFWGIGNNTENSNAEKYAFEQFNSSIHIKKKLGKHLFFGLMADYQNVLQLKYEPTSLLNQTNLFGKTPYQVLGFGITTSYDTRNFTFWPTKGVFLQAQATSYNKGVASDLSFNKVILEGRFFKSIFKNQILAFQFYNHSTIGDTPFRSYAILGGSTNLRGFYQGRFKDKSMASFIVEYRTHLFWKLSAVSFIGIGNVYQSIPTIQSLSIKHSFGGGLRISILEKDKLNLRIDYGYSDKYNNGFYFTLGECF